MTFLAVGLTKQSVHITWSICSHSTSFSLATESLRDAIGESEMERWCVGWEGGVCVCVCVFRRGKEVCGAITQRVNPGELLLTRGRGRR